MEWLSDLTVISGPLPWILTGLGALGGVWLLAARAPWFRRKALPLCLAVAAVVTLAVYIAVEKVLRPFPDPIEISIYVWIGVGLAAILLLIPRIRAGRTAPSAAVSVLAVIAVVLASATQINLVFDAYPTVGTAFGDEPFDRVDLHDLGGVTEKVVTGSPLDASWTPPPGMGDQGRVLTAHIPATQSNFTARDAEIYLPPAYFTNPRPLLPVLVLLAGQPGAPEDWLAGGKLTSTMDAFAAEHEGLAPVVVVADATGSQIANPLCVDSPLGNVATYLTKDVPAWVTSNLQVNRDPRAWAIGGLSYGGTCSLQMATNYPEVYPTFLDISGQEEPTLGDRQRTLDAAFGGSESAFEKVNPLDLLATKKYPDSAGVFVVGSDDADYRPGAQKVFQAAKDAGMDVQYLEVPGGHSFAVWSAGLEKETPWLAQRLGLIR
ncbi:alpha/beta hydrolase-fold protein [Rhodococcus oxybenzonivorans]|uniref:alpha/beta hydrolase n=1 Tax=Rhodococcus oxybenzonivorans TaxID=1990687 RepID=UPI0029555153|nr:alpha/beta hydrolase-fold protein [Rhodococcus oxybenzonivorans]MDV7357272.1 alpha/beta hydrolase-fold protein [Rhodococcus oxybenzonivorans]